MADRERWTPGEPMPSIGKLWPPWGDYIDHVEAERDLYRDALRAVLGAWDAFTGSDESRERVLSPFAAARDIFEPSDAGPSPDGFDPQADRRHRNG